MINKLFVFSFSLLTVMCIELQEYKASLVFSSGLLMYSVVDLYRYLDPFMEGKKKLGSLKNQRDKKGKL